MRFLNNHRFSRMSFARVLAHRFAIAYGDLPSETQAFLRRISARFIERAARLESAPYRDGGGRRDARPTEMCRALAKAIRVIRGLILALAMGVLSQGVLAATGSSPEFKVDLRGLGPWQRRTAAASEVLTYSSAWATNAASGTKAVVKVMPVLKTKPKYLVIDLSGGTNATSYGISQMVAYENGACGRARVNATTSLYAGNFMLVPSYDSLTLTNSFYVAAWFNVNEGFAFQNFLVRNDNRNNDDNGWVNGGGWGAQLRIGVTTNMHIVGGSNTKLLRCDIPDVKNLWVNLEILYAGTNAVLYTNGAFCAQHEINPVSDNGSPLGFGGWPNGRDGANLNGQYDEIRLRGGSLSAARIKADYDMIANRKFCTCGAVKKGAEE